MPLPVSRLFPKFTVKSDDAQLSMTANAIAVLDTAGGVDKLRTSRAPKELSIVLERPFRLVITANGANIDPGILTQHLKEALVSNASFLGISSPLHSQDAHVLVVEPGSPNQIKPYAILDYITLEYRFSRLSTAFEGTIGQGIFLPLRELLDQVVQRFIGQLVRQLPEAFGSWKDALIGETILARHIARHFTHLLNISTDGTTFQRKVGKQLDRIHSNMRTTEDQLAADLGQRILTAENEEPESQEPALNLRELLPFATQVAYKLNIRPKAGNRHIVNTDVSPKLVDDADPALTSSQDTLVSSSSLEDEEAIQLDSPISNAQSDQCASPAPSVLSLDRPPSILQADEDDQEFITGDSDSDMYFHFDNPASEPTSGVESEDEVLMDMDEPDLIHKDPDLLELSLDDFISLEFPKVASDYDDLVWEHDQGVNAYGSEDSALLELD